MVMLNWPFTAGMRRIGPGRMLVDLVPSVLRFRKLELQVGRGLGQSDYNHELDVGYTA